MSLSSCFKSIEQSNGPCECGADVGFGTDSALGVFEGVGSYAEHGFDRGTYPKKLSSLTVAHLRRTGASVQSALEDAFQKNNEVGGTTVCAVGLHGCILQGVNLGESGFIIIPNRMMHFQTAQRGGIRSTNHFVCGEHYMGTRLAAYPRQRKFLSE